MCPSCRPVGTEPRRWSRGVHCQSQKRLHFEVKRQRPRNNKAQRWKRQCSQQMRGVFVLEGNTFPARGPELSCARGLPGGGAPERRPRQAGFFTRGLAGCMLTGAGTASWGPACPECGPGGGVRTASVSLEQHSRAEGAGPAETGAGRKSTQGHPQRGAAVVADGWEGPHVPDASDGPCWCYRPGPAP